MDRKRFIQSVAALSLVGLGGGIFAGAAEPAAENPFAGKKVLVAYFSWSGNTRALAQTIQKATNGEIFELVPETPYPTEYRKCTEQAKEEINRNFRPALKAVPANLAGYDVIFVGSPNWWGTFAPPVSTFLDDPALAGKIVAPFFTHGGGGLQRCESDVRKRLTQSTVLKAFTVSGTSADSARTARNVNAWLREIAR